MKPSKTLFLPLTAGLLMASSASAQMSGGLGGYTHIRNPKPILSIAVSTVPQTEISMDSIQDLDGDRRREIIIGKPDEGIVEVRSSRNGAILLTFTGTVNSFGFSVANAGDVDGDTVDDIVVGSPWDNMISGAAYVYSGATGALISAFGPLSGVANSQGYGRKVAGGGDLNGDGLAEVLVSDPMYSQNLDFTYWGLVEVVDLNTGATPFLRSSMTGLAQWEQFGDSMCTIGDQNGDGIQEVLVGASRFFLGGVVGTAPGVARIYDGVSISSPAATPTILTTLNGNWAGDTYGYAVANVGDISKDGLDDYMVGAPDFGYLGGMSSEGYASFYANGVPPQNSWTYFEPRVDINRGLDVDAAGGDIDKDGMDDILVGCSGSWSGNSVAKVISGRTGKTIQVLGAKSISGTMGQAVCTLGKYPRSKKPHMAVADPGAAMVHIF